MPGDVGRGGDAGLRQLAGLLRSVAAGVDVRRASLGPAALTWWSGPGAEAHEERVAERRAALARLGDDLRTAAVEAEALADGRPDAGGRGP